MEDNGEIRVRLAAASIQQLKGLGIKRLKGGWGGRGGGVLKEMRQRTEKRMGV